MKKSPILKKKKKMHNPIWNLREQENTGKNREKSGKLRKIINFLQYIVKKQSFS